MSDLHRLTIKFAEFIESAKLLPKKPTAAANTSHFLTFIREASHFLTPKPTTERLARFQLFVDEALPLVVRETKRQLPALAERARMASKWLVRDDLLSIAGFTYVEDSYTELIRWALDPDTHQPTAVRRQQAWLQAVGLHSDICSKECMPQTQVWTDDGIPDLILKYPDVAVVVEAKTGTSEHLTPSGEFQTIAYAHSVRKSLQLPKDARVEVVYLTTDRQLPKNTDAKPTTFTDFVFALASVLEGAQMPVDTRAAYAMLFTHFLIAVPDVSYSVRELIDDVIRWSADPNWLDDQLVLYRMKRLLQAIALLQPERADG